MSVPVITFDCAQTLVEVSWNPATLTCEVAEACGGLLDHQIGAERYQRMLGSRWGHFRQLNLQRSARVCDSFWTDLARDWLRDMELSPDLLPSMMAMADERIYGADSKIFRVFDDVVPVLDRLKAKGIRMAVLSNWDVSLHRVLRGFELTPYFELVVASLEEGVEKPDPALFALTLDRLGATPDQVVHVGDSPLDDLQGARNAGIRGLLLDRGQAKSEGYVLATLHDLEEALGI